MLKKMEKVKKRTALAAFFVWITLSTQTALAHDGQPPAPHDLWSAWNWEPLIVLSLTLGAWIYARGLQVLRQRPGLRGAGSRQTALGWRAASFTMGLIMLFLALISPLEALGAALFSAHMLQHILLIVVAPPLLILGVPLSSFLLGLSPSVRNLLGRRWRRAEWLRATWRTLTQPLVPWSLHTLSLWVWHVPMLYEAALQNDGIHLLEHLSFLGTALLFWWKLMHPDGRMTLGAGFAILALFTMTLQGGLLGALITFAPTPWYTVYVNTTQSWGLTPLQDQQLAGAIMWIPAGAVYTLAALHLVMIRLASIERAAHQRESRTMDRETKLIN
jgi:putative membrane protein